MGGDTKASNCRVPGLRSLRGKVTSPWCISEKLCEGMRFQEVSATLPDGDRTHCPARAKDRKLPQRLWLDSSNPG